MIGEISGTEQGDEVVILAAHLDSWDPGVGAIDNGAGVAIMMSAAKLIGGLETKPRRTIRVVLFANEEFGTSGSQAYVGGKPGGGCPARARLRGGLRRRAGVAPI